MRDDSDDDFTSVQDVGEDFEDQVDESEQVEFFEALLHLIMICQCSLERVWSQ
jgi:hypothetical protein